MAVFGSFKYRFLWYNGNVNKYNKKSRFRHGGGFLRGENDKICNDI